MGLFDIIMEENIMKKYKLPLDLPIPDYRRLPSK